MNRTIYREVSDRGLKPSILYPLKRYCQHNHRSPRAASRCPETHNAAAPKGMRSTAQIGASDDGGQS